MEAKPRILIIYTGGTIGMIKDPVTGELTSVDFNHIHSHVPELLRLNIDLVSRSFEKPIDSSEIGITHWQEIAQTIFENYTQFDGFVVLHGSDTMAYTASALSFMLDGLKKPVILTGSQLPIGIIRTDGKENLITAIEIAATKDDDGEAMVQEVAVYFDYYLFRGNRSTKDSANLFEAFRSPNYPVLATAGVEIQYNREKFFRTKSNELSLHTNFNNRVALIKLFPGIPFNLYRNIFNRETIDGVVIETYGAGNAPTSEELTLLLKDFIANGGIVLNITQCNSGKVQQGMYQTSSLFNKLGVVSGGDMTSEAAITKLMAVMDAENPVETKLKLTTDLRGEVFF